MYKGGNNFRSLIPGRRLSLKVSGLWVSVGHLQPFEEGRKGNLASVCCNGQFCFRSATNQKLGSLELSYRAVVRVGRSVRMDQYS